MHIICSVCVRGWVIVFLGTSVHDVGCSVAFSGGDGMGGRIGIKNIIKG